MFKVLRENITITVDKLKKCYEQVDKIIDEQVDNNF